MLEMTLVVALLGVIAAAVVPGLSAGNPQRLELAADEAATALRFARGEALRTGQPHGVRVKTGPASLDVFRLDTSGANPVEVYDVYHPQSKHLYSQLLAAPPFPTGTSIGADFRYVAAGPATAAVAFDTRGEPLSPVDLDPLYHPGTLLVGVLRKQRTVAVDTVTGRVTVGP